MIILDEDRKQELEYLTLYLTKAEATELIGALKNLIERPKDNHAHINSIDYEKEITVCIYDSEKKRNEKEKN